MSKLGKKVDAAATEAAGALIKAGGLHGRFGFTVANAVCATLLGRYMQLCDDGVDCADPDHDHVDLKLRD
jgi:hypothetical protein